VLPAGEERLVGGSEFDHPLGLWLRHCEGRTAAQTETRREGGPGPATPTFIGALAHPPPAHGDPLGGSSAAVGRPVGRPVGRLLRHVVVHLRLDEELQDVGALLVVVVVVLVMVVVVVPEAAATAVLRAQHQVAVVETAMHGFVHDVEPGPRLHDPPGVVLALVGLLQVLGDTVGL